MRSLVLVALAAALALPRVALAQTPSVTPTPAPVTLTIRFDCGAVPWSCGDGPNDVRWQLYEAVGCDGSSQTGCRYERVGHVVPEQTLALWPAHRYKLFLAPNLDRSDRVRRACSTLYSKDFAYLSIHSECTVYETVCAGPLNWQIYADTSAGLLPAHKHIGECSRFGFYTVTATSWVMHWGLPGELAAAPTGTMTAPPPATLTPTVSIPTEAPTLAVTPTASATATDAPTATVTASATRTPTATVTRGVVWLPRVGR